MRSHFIFAVKEGGQISKDLKYDLRLSLAQCGKVIDKDLVFIMLCSDDEAYQYIFSANIICKIIQKKITSYREIIGKIEWKTGRVSEISGFAEYLFVAQSIFNILKLNDIHVSQKNIFLLENGRLLIELSAIKNMLYITLENYWKQFIVKSSLISRPMEIVEAILGKNIIKNVENMIDKACVFPSLTYGKNCYLLYEERKFCFEGAIRLCRQFVGLVNEVGKITKTIVPYKDGELMLIQYIKKNFSITHYMPAKSIFVAGDFLFIESSCLKDKIFLTLEDFKEKSKVRQIAINNHKAELNLEIEKNISQTDLVFTGIFYNKNNLIISRKFVEQYGKTGQMLLGVIDIKTRKISRTIAKEWKPWRVKSSDMIRSFLKNRNPKNQFSCRKNQLFCYKNQFLAIKPSALNGQPCETLEKFQHTTLEDKSIDADKDSMDVDIDRKTGVSVDRLSY